MTDETMNVRSSEGGEPQVFQRRRAVTYLKNGKRSNDYLQINVRAITVIAALVGALATIAGVVLGAVKFVAEPMLREAVQAQVAPFSLMVDAESKRLDAHFLEVAQKANLYVTREELRHDLDEIKQGIRDIRAEARR